MKSATFEYAGLESDLGTGAGTDISFSLDIRTFFWKTPMEKKTEYNYKDLRKDVRTVRRRTIDVSVPFYGNFNQDTHDLDNLINFLNAPYKRIFVGSTDYPGCPFVSGNTITMVYKDFTESFLENLAKNREGNFTIEEYQGSWG